jgi:hypothetical protein
VSDHLPDAEKMVCPHCNSPARDDWPSEYRCKAVNLSGRITRSPVCYEGQIAELKAKVKRLEEAGDILATWAPLDRTIQWCKAKGQP